MPEQAGGPVFAAIGESAMPTFRGPPTLGRRRTRLVCPEPEEGPAPWPTGGPRGWPARTRCACTSRGARGLRAGAAGPVPDRWWVTMPPGAGKTLVGTEVARRLGRRTVVFSPNTAIQGQWAAHVGRRTTARGPAPSRDLRDRLHLADLPVARGLRRGRDEDDRAPGSQLDRLHPNGLALVETPRAGRTADCSSSTSATTCSRCGAGCSREVLDRAARGASCSA